MTIELANRLVEFRKKFGYSQEELANQLNVSRQSISNWESGEVTPSIDYLKELAKIYNVSMDDLINCDKTVEEVLNKNSNTNKEFSTEKSDENAHESKQNYDQVHIGKDGIHVSSKDGDKVDIDLGGVHINDYDKNIYDNKCSGFNNAYSKYKKRKHLANNIESIISGVLALLVFVAYMVLGFLVPNGWAIYWTLFILIPVPGEIVSCFIMRKASRFPIALVVTFLYLFFGMYAGLWHPYWLVFCLIPVFYMIVSPIEKALFQRNLAKDNDDSVVTINGEDIKIHSSSSDKIDNINKSFNKVEGKISTMTNEINKLQGKDKDFINDIYDDLENELDDLDDLLEEIEDDITDLEEINNFPLDEKIEYRSRIRKYKNEKTSLEQRIKSLK